MGAETKFLHHLQGSAHELRYSSTLPLPLSSHTRTDKTQIHVCVPSMNLICSHICECFQGISDQKRVVQGDASFKSNHRTLETFTENIKRADDCKLSLSMNSKASRSSLKVHNNTADVDDVSLELTLA